MYSRIFSLFALLILLRSNPCRAQDLNINGDTIRVSAQVNATIMFPDEIQHRTPTCAADQYRFQQNRNTLTVRPGVDNPVSPCYLIVEEGNGTNNRNHTFVIYFVPEGGEIDPSAAVHDLHTIDLVKQRIAVLKASKNTSAASNDVQGPPAADGTQQAPAAAPAPTATPATQGLTDGPDTYNLDGYIVARKQVNDQVGVGVNYLQQYISILANHSRPDVRNVIDKAMELFNNDETRSVTVTNLKGEPTIRRVREYFSRLSQLTYKSVNVTFSDLQFVSKLEKHPDGLWYGTVSYQQTFVATREGRIAYKDIQKKSLTIIVKVYDVIKEGEQKKMIKIFLGNIGVSENK